MKILLFGLASIVLISCRNPSATLGQSPNSAPPPAVALQPGDDPAYDWEAPGHPQRRDAGDWSNVIHPRFSNSRSLRQTTSWLNWALETYGHVKGPADSTDIGDVKFPGCSMEWDEKRFLDNGNFMNETIYTVKLADIDISYGALTVDDAVRFGNAEGLANPKIHKLEKFWQKEGSRMKSRGDDRASTDASAVIPVQQRDDICRRIGWALIHAVSLCGGKPLR